MARNKMKKISLLYLLFLFLMIPVVANAQKVTVQNGNLILQSHDGKETILTHSGRDTEPALSPDGKWIVFVRQYPGKPGPWGPGTELRIIRTEGTGERVIVKDGAVSGRNKFLSSLNSPQFLNDSRRVAFHSGWAATHGSVHVVDIKTGAIRFVSGGNSVCSVNSDDYKDKYKDYLIIKIRRYFFAGGSYEFYYLVSIDGKVGAPVGDSEISIAGFCEPCDEKK
jgi:hypothetical protein